MPAAVPRPDTAPDAAHAASGGDAAGASAILMRERLSPSAAVVLVAAAAGAVFGVVLVPLSLVAAVIVGVVLAVAAAVGVHLAAPEVVVAEDEVRAGPAAIEPTLLGAPEVLDADAWALAMGQDYEPLAFHCTRGWMHGGVRVPVLDPEDPTPAWVIASRRPEQLALALDAARRRA